jgi:murein DD-endopeptidase MepM/ murein hydrolase activator NlpD
METVIPSIDKVVITGTKKRPKDSSLGESTGRMMWPVPSLHMITTYFTWRWGSFHTGIDISGGGAYGRTIVAADGGVVVSAGWKNGYGNCVQIRHSNGLQTLYGHASKILVTPGQRVSKGQAIARVGSTGNSTGPHCHFEVIKSGAKVNPLSYIGR